MRKERRRGKEGDKGKTNTGDGMGEREQGARCCRAKGERERPPDVSKLNVKENVLVCRTERDGKGREGCRREKI